MKNGKLMLKHYKSTSYWCPHGFITLSPHREDKAVKEGLCLLHVLLRSEECQYFHIGINWTIELHTQRDGLLVKTTTRKLPDFSFKECRYYFYFCALKNDYQHALTHTRPKGPWGIQVCCTHTNTCAHKEHATRTSEQCVSMCPIKLLRFATHGWCVKFWILIWKHQFSWIWVKPYMVDEACYFKIND